MTALRIAVIGDIHANALALDAAFTAVRRRGCDHSVLLGDLLTYGVDVSETLQRVAEWLQDSRHCLLRGNHDQMYDECLSGGSAYGEQLPGWIRESAEWTLERIDPKLWASLPFRDEWTCAGGLFSHANPFGLGNWRYLNRPEDYAEAATALTARGCAFGVFGHSHRARYWSGDGALQHWSVAAGRPLPLGSAGGAAVLNAGSPGQPREGSACPPLLLWLEFSAEGGRFHFEALEHDEQAHVQRLLGAGLSRELLQRLRAYHPSIPAQPSAAGIH